MNATQSPAKSERMTRLGLLTEPAGYVDGPNLYEYVGSNPVNQLDPLGLQTTQAAPKWRISYQPRGDDRQDNNWSSGWHQIVVHETDDKGNPKLDADGKPIGVPGVKLVAKKHGKIKVEWPSPVRKDGRRWEPNCTDSGGVVLINVKRDGQGGGSVVITDVDGGHKTTIHFPQKGLPNVTD